MQFWLGLFLCVALAVCAVLSFATRRRLHFYFVESAGSAVLALERADGSKLLL